MDKYIFLPNCLKHLVNTLKVTRTKGGGKERQILAVHRDELRCYSHVVVTADLRGRGGGIKKTKRTKKTASRAARMQSRCVTGKNVDGSKLKRHLVLL